MSDVESIILALQSETSNMHENIAKALHARLSELTGRVAEIESELRKPLSADSEERALTSKIRRRSKQSRIPRCMKFVKFKRP